MTEILSSAGIKRQMLIQSDVSGIRKKMEKKLTVDREAEVVEIGDAFEEMVKVKGWIFLEAYIMKQIMDNMIGNGANENTKGFIHIMHYIDQVIKLKDAIIEKRKKEAE